VWLIPASCGRQLLLLLVLSPVLEELVLRAGLQEWLIRRLPAARVLPVLVSAAAFGLLHWRSGWPHALAVTVPGLALALLYQRTRSWCWCACVHSAMNAFAISVCSL
jgi:membrane protease YdiL (CAAX protease family)